MDRKLQRHRTVSLRQHGFLVLKYFVLQLTCRLLDIVYNSVNAAKSPNGIAVMIQMILNSLSYKLRTDYCRDCNCLL